MVTTLHRRLGISSTFVCFLACLTEFFSNHQSHSSKPQMKTMDIFKTSTYTNKKDDTVHFKTINNDSSLSSAVRYLKAPVVN